VNLKSAYCSSILIIFLRNMGKSCNSITQVMKLADVQMKKLGIENNLSESTKYTTVKEMIESGILISRTRKKGKNLTVSLSKKIQSYFIGELNGD